MPMDGGQPNYFTINGRSFPATDTIPMKVGETLKVRFVGSNNGFIHPMHIHGGPFRVVAVDGETLQPSARFDADTVNVGPGQRYDVIWRAREAGQVAHPLPHRPSHDEQQRRDGGRRRADDDYRRDLAVFAQRVLQLCDLAFLRIDDVLRHRAKFRISIFSSFGPLRWRKRFGRLLWSLPTPAAKFDRNPGSNGSHDELVRYVAFRHCAA